MKYAIIIALAACFLAVAVDASALKKPQRAILLNNEGLGEDDDSSSSSSSSSESGSGSGECDVECVKDWDEDEYHPNPGDCGSFCQCSNGVPYYHPCPSGLHFNKKLNVCDWPRDAKCTEED